MVQIIFARLLLKLVRENGNYPMGKICHIINVKRIDRYYTPLYEKTLNTFRIRWHAPQSTPAWTSLNPGYFGAVDDLIYFNDPSFQIGGMS
jgi:hypothetical protein